MFGFISSTHGAIITADEITIGELFYLILVGFIVLFILVNELRKFFEEK
jgi:hypothetical protein